MSLILDALRKSEAERRRGQAPGLYTSLPPPSTRRRPSALRYLPWVVAAVLLVVALLAFREQSPATKEDLAGARPIDDGIGPNAATPVLVEPTASTPASTPTAPSPPPVAAASPAPTFDALVKPAPTAVIAPAVAPASAPAPLPPAPSATAATADAAEDALPPVAVLDPGARNSLPPLKLSMHFYNNDPARRFAIIDGHRVSEGTQLGAAVVTEIRRDGVVLDVNGQRVLLPRP